MTHVRVAILHRTAGPGDGPLGTALIAARAALAERHRATFAEAGADEVRVIAGPPDARPFGARLRDAIEGLGHDDGLVVLGSGAAPFLTRRLAAGYVGAARGPAAGALVNNRHSADMVSIARAREALVDVPDLPTDNALPRWLAERAGVGVVESPPADRRRLAFDLDTPLDLVLLGGAWARSLPGDARRTVEDRLLAVRATTADPSAELLIAGRTSADALARLERGTRSRTRALVEERGLRTAVPGQRRPASVLGLLLDRDGPTALGAHLARLGDAAIIDTRVLLAHRLGADERRWPAAEDRFASDLLLPDRVHDRWLRELTAAACAAPIPVLLGAHTLVGPGLALVIGDRR